MEVQTQQPPLFECSFYLALPELKSKFIHSFHLFFLKMGSKKQGQGIPFSAVLRDLTDFTISEDVLCFLYEEHFQ